MHIVCITLHRKGKGTFSHFSYLFVIHRLLLAKYFQRETMSVQQGKLCWQQLVTAFAFSTYLEEIRVVKHYFLAISGKPSPFSMRLCTEKLPVFKFTWHSRQALTWNSPVNQKCSKILRNNEDLIGNWGVFWTCWSCRSWDFDLIWIQAGDDGVLQPVVPQSDGRPGGRWW